MPTGTHPLSIGARMMVRVSEWTFIVNSGGIAEAISFGPLQGQKRFFLSALFRQKSVHLPQAKS